MNNFSLIQVAYAAEETVSETGTEPAEAKHEGGLSIQPTTIAFQALNFIILLVVLNAILYKPLTKLLSEREKKIKDGVENAEKAEGMLKESNIIRQDMIRTANADSQNILEKARKAGEEVKTGIIAEAQSEANKIVKSGHTIVEAEKAKAMQEVKQTAVNAIIMAAEKLLKEKIDQPKDAKMIEESLNSYSA